MHKISYITLLCFSAFSVSIWTSASSSTSKSAERISDRIIYNSAEDRTITAAWYLRSKKGASLHSDKVTIDSHTWKVLPQPSARQAGKNELRLVLSYDSACMAQYIDWDDKDKKFISLKIGDLAVDEKFNVFSQIARNPKGASGLGLPQRSLTIPIVSITNTSNKSVFCAPYSVDPEKQMQSSRIITSSIELQPQQRYLFAFDDSTQPLVNESKIAFSLKKAELKDNVDARHFAMLKSVAVKKTSAAAKEQEYIILPPIKVESDTSEVFIVVTPDDVTKPQFLIDRVIAFLHEVPELTPSEKAKLEIELKKLIGEHDASLFQEIVGQDDWFEGPIRDLPKEKDFVERRKKVTQRSIYNLLKSDVESGKFPEITLQDLSNLDLLPSIAFVSTGGGYRAMIETTGFLEGAEDSGVLQCCTYMCGLSGSTWAMNSWVASNGSVCTFADSLQKKVGKKDAPEGDRARLLKITDTLAKFSLLSKDAADGFINLFLGLSESQSYKLCKFIQSRFGQDQGFVGLYGHALAEALLKDLAVNGKKSPHSIMLSDLSRNLESPLPAFPLPLSVCLHSPYDASNTETKWFEFSPYYVGTYDTKEEPHGWFIPTDKFGSYYLDRKVVYRCPEYPLGQLYGIFGSAMAISASTLEDYKKQQASSALAFVKFINTNRLLGSNFSYDEKRLTGAPMPNFLFHEPTSLSDKPDLFSKRTLRLVDGGMLSLFDHEEKHLCHNFATMPALYRKCDVLILTDCNGKPNSERNMGHLQAAFKEARNKGFKMPSVSEERFRTIDTKTDVFTSEDSNCPSVVYMLGQRHDESVAGFDPDSIANASTATKYFFYDEEIFKRLRKLTSDLFKRSENIENIKKAIINAIAKKKRLQVLQRGASVESQSSTSSGSKKPETVAPDTPSSTSTKLKKHSSKTRKLSKDKHVSRSHESKSSKKSSSKKHDDNDDHDDSSSESDDNSKLASTSASKKVSPIGTFDQDVDVHAAPGSHFNMFVEAFPKYVEEQCALMRDFITSLPETMAYEEFAKFMSYAAQHNSPYLVGCVIEKASKAPNYPQDRMVKMYATVNQTCMVLGSQNDPLYCSDGGDSPLHFVAKNGDVALFKIFLEKNIFALGHMNSQKQNPLHLVFICQSKACIDAALNFFEDIDSITIDHPDYTPMLKKLVSDIFLTPDGTNKTVKDYAQDQETKKRIRRILIKYYISSGL